MLLLAFDTATPAVTVALHDGTRVLARESATGARRQGELLAPSIRKVLAAAAAVPGDLTGIAVGVGPGPYTGLRAGLVTARVLGSALGVPVHGACTLDVIARQAAEAAAGREFIVATESGILHQMEKACPDKTFISAPGEGGCSCSECPYMKLNTMEKLYLCMRDRKPEITLEEGLRQRALRPIVRMLEMS